METTLADNIRAFRKERGLTRDQLSEVLGVTPGAVYKWEAKLSIPDLYLIMEMADFFDTSVDVLLGYEMKDNRLEATVKRLQEYRRQKDRAGLAEADKALKKYPHSFEIVKESSALYRAFGFESGDKDLLRRGLELLEQTRLLLPQNTDPEISEQTICGRMAQTYLGLDETEKAIELWKAHNADGLFNHHLGHILAQTDRLDEAVPYLSEALTNIVGELCDVIIGYINVYFKRGDYTSAEAILRLGIGFFSDLRKEGKPNFLDKISCVFLAALASAQKASGRINDAHESLKEAKRLAEFYDASPSYDETDIRFITRIEGASAHDSIGATAMDAVENTVNEYEDKELKALWSSVIEQEKEENE